MLNVGVPIVRQCIMERLSAPRFSDSGIRLYRSGNGGFGGLKNLVGNILLLVSFRRLNQGVISTSIGLDAKEKESIVYA